MRIAIRWLNGGLKVTHAAPAQRLRRVEGRREGYLRLLEGLFALFNSARILAYVPTIWAVAISGDSSQHSLWTWLVFFGANVTMAAWLWERNGRHSDGTFAVSVGNGIMCAGVIAAVAWTRL